jgi:outer membrane protein TolC
MEGAMSREILIVLSFGMFCTAFATAADSPEAKKLLMERRNVLKEVNDIQRRGYERGELQLPDLLLTNRDLLEAELELADDKSQRIAICERLVKTFEDIEAISQRRQASGEVTIMDTLNSKAARLKAQARLANERQSSN